MNKILVISISLAAILSLGAFGYTFYKSIKPTAEIRGNTFRLEVVKNDKDKQIGLSKYKNFPKDQGMLFVFDKAGFYPFWMKDMKFPIDIIFINNNKITTIYSNLPINVLTIYSPTSPSDKVFEIDANLSKQYGFNKGDLVNFKNVQ